MFKLASSIVFGAATFVLSTSFAFGADVEVSEARVRLMPGDVPSAGYFSLHNGSDETITLVGANSDAFGHVELHMSMEKDGMAHMHAVPKIEVAAGENFEFAPSGYHLMLMKRSAPLEVGGETVINLEFEDRGAVPVNFEVVSPSAM